MKHKYKNINDKLNKLRKEQGSNTHKKTHAFYNRSRKYLSDVTFTGDEIQLLNKGLKYNLHHKKRNWIETLAIEAETAITQINQEEQAYMRQCVSNKLQKIIKAENNRKITQKTKQNKESKRKSL
jgi:hypothetical protein